MSFNDPSGSQGASPAAVTPPPATMEPPVAPTASSAPGPMYAPPTTSVPPPPVPAHNPWAPAGGYSGQTAMFQHFASPEDKAFTLKPSPGRVAWKDQLSDFRTGHITLGPSGVTLSGKALPPPSTRSIVYLISFLTIGLLIGYLIIEYAMRQDKTDFVTWDCVEGVSYDRSRRRVCISYHYPNKPKVSYALGLTLDPLSLDMFVNTVNQYVPGLAVERKILSQVSRGGWIFLALLGVGILALILAAIFS